MVWDARMGQPPSGSNSSMEAGDGLVVIILAVYVAKYSQGDLHLVGKAVQPLQSVKIYSNSRVLGHEHNLERPHTG